MQKRLFDSVLQTQCANKKREECWGREEIAIVICDRSLNLWPWQTWEFYPKQPNCHICIQPKASSSELSEILPKLHYIKNANLISANALDLVGLSKQVSLLLLYFLVDKSCLIIAIIYIYLQFYLTLKYFHYNIFCSCYITDF